MISKIDPSRYADTGFSIADTPPELNALLFRRMMAKTGAERLIIGCQMAGTARALVWSGIPQDLPEFERRTLFLERFFGGTVAAITSGRFTVADSQWLGLLDLGRLRGKTQISNQARILQSTKRISNTINGV